MALPSRILLAIYVIAAIVLGSCSGHLVDDEATHTEHGLQHLNHVLADYDARFTNSTSHRYFHKCRLLALDAYLDTLSGQACMDTRGHPDVKKAQIYFGAAVYYLGDCFATIKAQNKSSNPKAVNQAYADMEAQLNPIGFHLQSALNAVPDLFKQCVYE